MDPRLSTFLTALAFAVIAPVTNANPPTLFSSEISGKDLAFLTAIADAAVLQSNLGELAKMRGTSEAVKLIGGAVATFHSKAKGEVEILANQKNVAVSTAPSRAQISVIDRVSKAVGTQFDERCLEEMMRIQQREIAQVESATQSNDEDVKAFAIKLLPQLREQILLAQKIAAKKAQPAPTFRAREPGVK